MNTDLKEFTQATIEALYFTETGEDDQPAKDAEMDEECRLDIEADCRSWWRRYGCFVMTEACICNRHGESHSKAAQAGHDFWLTRNGHGAGFWDGDWSDNYATMFTKGAQEYGIFNVLKGDDGNIHSS